MLKDLQENLRIEKETINLALADKESGENLIASENKKRQYESAFDG
jgi:hypothetical protein